MTLMVTGIIKGIIELYKWMWLEGQYALLSFVTGSILFISLLLYNLLDT